MKNTLAVLSLFASTLGATSIPFNSGPSTVTLAPGGPPAYSIAPNSVWNTPAGSTWVSPNPCSGVDWYLAGCEATMGTYSLYSTLQGPGNLNVVVNADDTFALIVDDSLFFQGVSFGDTDATHFHTCADTSGCLAFTQTSIHVNLTAGGNVTHTLEWQLWQAPQRASLGLAFNGTYNTVDVRATPEPVTAGIVGFGLLLLIVKTKGVKNV